MKKLKIKKHNLIFVGILLGIFLLRLPSLFEPFWYGDEGIFAAVSRNLNLGGVLYQSAWDNKPPMIYLTYGGIFKFLGVSMFSLRLVAMAVVLLTAGGIYAIGQAVMNEKRALWAMGIFGILTSLRVIEGNLALTEIFMILPIVVAMFVAIKRKFDVPSLVLAGGLFAIASLYKQVGAFETAALGIYLFLIAKNFKTFIKCGLWLFVGFAIPYAVTVFYFWQKHLLFDYIFAAYTYYRIYLNESPQYAAFINIFKYFPFLVAIAFGIWAKLKKRVSIINLFFLWGAVSFLGSFFSGRTYGHYLVQATPALALLVASVNVKPKFKQSLAFVILFVLPILILIKLLFGGLFTWNPTDQIAYYKNFLSYASGSKSIDSYNNFFDRNVNTIMAVSDFLNSKGAKGESVYIWGDLPWIYAIDDLKNPSRYVTSFHVFGVPQGKEEVISDILAKKPRYILKMESSIGYFAQLENLIASGYTQEPTVQGVEVFLKKGD